MQRTASLISAYCVSEGHPSAVGPTAVARIIGDAECDLELSVRRPVLLLKEDGSVVYSTLVIKGIAL